MTPEPRFVVVGIGADGWHGLGGPARDELRSAHVIYGAPRQLGLLDDVREQLGATLVPWRSPMSEHLTELIDGTEAVREPIHVLASGDPMFHGVGASIVSRVGAGRVRVLPAVSSASLACARLGWDLAGTRVVSAVTAPPAVVLGEASDGVRLLVLSRDRHTPIQVAQTLSRNGFDESTMTVLQRLGGPDEDHRTGTVRFWAEHDPDDLDPLNVIAVDCAGPRRTALPGREDDAYEHDGQITKSTIRALTVCALEPVGPQRLWDIGGGSGSVSIEWLRADPRGRADVFERDPRRAQDLADNASRHGVTHRLTVHGAAPEALTDAAAPDAIFIGGGLDDALLDTAWKALLPGGRIVVNAVTVASQDVVLRAAAARGGAVTRLAVETVQPLGTMTTWRPALPIVQWVATKNASEPAADLRQAAANTHDRGHR